MQDERTGRAVRKTTLAAVLLTALASCDRPGNGVAAMSEPRTYEPVGRTLRWGASDAERFGTSAADFAANAKNPARAAPSYDLPTGWVELPPAPMREVNLAVAGDARAGCYLTTLNGEAGGLAANVNRWRGQLSLPPLTAEEIAALPRVEWLGRSAVLADFEGAWTGMAGDGEPSEGRLVGLLAIDPSRSRFLKMVGPRDVIAREVGAFRALVASFREGTAAKEPAKATPAATEAPAASGTLAWTAPAGWQRGPDKAMREVTFLAGPKGEVECYVTLLAGDGGGLRANLDRWSGQMGQEPLSERELAALARVTILGADGVVAEIPRGSDATAPAEHELLIGALSIQPEQSLFVKMVGPRAAVEAQREAFLELCRSLRSAG
jgi:hypothetical protein